MTLRTLVSMCKDVPAACGVSCGLDYRSSVPTTLALIPLGYADGIPRIATGGPGAGHCARCPRVPERLSAHRHSPGESGPRVAWPPPTNHPLSRSRGRLQAGAAGPALRLEGEVQLEAGLAAERVDADQRADAPEPVVDTGAVQV